MWCKLLASGWGRVLPISEMMFSLAHSPLMCSWSLSLLRSFSTDFRSASSSSRILRRISSTVSAPLPLGNDRESWPASRSPVSVPVETDSVWIAFEYVIGGGFATGCCVQDRDVSQES